jgi:glycosyltransferase involved in cell wall biosynthesis
VDTRRWTPNQKAEDGDGTLHVITVGRLHEAKGHDDLLRALARLTAEGRKVTLRMFEMDRGGRNLKLFRDIKFEGSVSEERIIDAQVGRDETDPPGTANALLQNDAKPRSCGKMGVSLAGAGKYR